MNAAWLRGVRDLLDGVLGDRPAPPLGQRVAGLPTARDLDQEDLDADDIVSQGRPGGTMVQPEAYPPTAIRRGHPSYDPLAMRRRHPSVP
jgi:hypothetical protein